MDARIVAGLITSGVGLLGVLLTIFAGRKKPPSPAVAGDGPFINISNYNNNTATASFRMSLRLRAGFASVLVLIAGIALMLPWGQMIPSLAIPPLTTPSPKPTPGPRDAIQQELNHYTKDVKAHTVDKDSAVLRKYMKFPMRWFNTASASETRVAHDAFRTGNRVFETPKVSKICDHTKSEVTVLAEVSYHPKPGRTGKSGSVTQRYTWLPADSGEPYRMTSLVEEEHC